MRHYALIAATLVVAVARPMGATEVRQVTREGKTFVAVRTKLLDLLVAPHSGGQMTSLVYRPRDVQMGNRGSLDWGLFSDHDLKQPHPGELMRAPYQVRVEPVGSDGRATHEFTSRQSVRHEDLLMRCSHRLCGARSAGIMSVIL